MQQHYGRNKERNSMLTQNDPRAKVGDNSGTEQLEAKPTGTGLRTKLENYIE